MKINLDNADVYAVLAARAILPFILSMYLSIYERTSTLAIVSAICVSCALIRFDLAMLMSVFFDDDDDEFEEDEGDGKDEEQK